MPEVSAMKNSNFLKRDEVGRGALLTIHSCEQMNVAKEGDKAEMKWCLTFQEDVKPMVLNSTNAQLIANFTGISNSDNWGGQKIVCYDDPSVSYGGKLVGGIRVRAPRVPQAAPVAPIHREADQKPANAAPYVPATEDDPSIPF